MHGLSAPQLADLLPFTPVEKAGGGTRVCRTRVVVADIEGEIFEEAHSCPVPGCGNQRGKVGGEVLAGDRMSTDYRVASGHGLNIVTSRPAKSLTLRVTRVRRCSSAVAAI
jgi:hypothetical protein